MIYVVFLIVGRKSTDRQIGKLSDGGNMGLFSIFKRKHKDDDFIFQAENLYEKIKSDSENEVVTEMYEPLDKDLINQTIIEEKLNNTSSEKKSYAERLCEQMVICSQRIEGAKKEYKAVNDYINDIQTIENLEEPAKSSVEYYARRIITLREDKKSMKEHSTKIPESKYIYMQRHEHEIQEILKTIYDDEQECQRLKTDMHHIEGEKVALKYEKRDATKKLQIIRTFVKMGMVTVLLILGMLLAAMVVSGEDMVLAIYGVVIAALVGAAVLMVLNQKYEAELSLTDKKINKAIGLMNKYKLLYVNVRSRLDYEYEVHGVKSSYELNDLWRLYINAKKEHEAFHLNADNTYKAIDGLISELENAHVSDPSVWPSQVDAIIDGKNMNEIRTTLNVRRQKLRQSIEFNTTTMENSKNQIQKLIDKNPTMAKEILAILDKYESVLGTDF